MRFDDVCEQLFSQNGPYWHLCTPGDLSGVLFRDQEDYVFCMNAVALTVADFVGEISIFTFQIMSNHLHFVFAGGKENILQYYDKLRKRLGRYFSSKYGFNDIRKVNCNLIPVLDLKYLRNLIAYVNRNGYVVSRNETPFSYRWGANAYFFNPLICNETQQLLSGMPVDSIRKLFRTRDYKSIRGCYLVNGYVSPLCFCKISLAENLYRDANHYFNLVSRQIEAFSDLAKELGDRVTFTDDEIYFAVLTLCKREYKVDFPHLLGKDEKIIVAKIMHYDYNSTNKQIKRILRLDEYVIDSLFPRENYR